MPDPTKLVRDAEARLADGLHKRIGGRSYPINDLAQELYVAWCGYELATRNLAHPKWALLRDNHKTHWLTVAEQTLALEASREWADGGES